MDRSIKPGDVISLSGQSGTSTENFGWVQELRGRYVVVRDRDGIEMLVPNQQLISNAVINWSYTDPRIRLKLPVRVSYSDDPELALQILLRRVRRPAARAARSAAGVALDAIRRSRHRARTALLDFRPAGGREQRPLGGQSHHLGACSRSTGSPYPWRSARSACTARTSGSRLSVARAARRSPPQIAIPDEELEWKFIRSSGPGGQNVNKVASAVQLRFLLPLNTSLPAAARNRLRRLAGQKTDRRRQHPDQRARERSQEQNRRAALERLAELIRAALIEPKIRKKTRPTRASKERRIESKKRRAEHQAARAPAGTRARAAGH